MPVMDGFEATEKIKSLMNLNEIKSCPVICVTAYDSFTDIEKILEKGAD
jgi:CheY-like chemotaxis protein